MRIANGIAITCMTAAPTSTPSVDPRASAAAPAAPARPPTSAVARESRAFSGDEAVVVADQPRDERALRDRRRLAEHEHDEREREEREALQLDRDQQHRDRSTEVRHRDQPALAAGEPVDHRADERAHDGERAPGSAGGRAGSWACAASADTLKKREPASDTVKRASPVTPMEFATTRRRYGSAPNTAVTARSARDIAPVCTSTPAG